MKILVLWIWRSDPAVFFNRLKLQITVLNLLEFVKPETAKNGTFSLSTGAEINHAILSQFSLLDEFFTVKLTFREKDSKVLTFVNLLQVK